MSVKVTLKYNHSYSIAKQAAIHTSTCSQNNKQPRREFYRFTLVFNLSRGVDMDLKLLTTLAVKPHAAIEVVCAGIGQLHHRWALVEDVHNVLLLTRGKVILCGSHHYILHPARV